MDYKSCSAVLSAGRLYVALRVLRLVSFVASYFAITGRRVLAVSKQTAPSRRRWLPGWIKTEHSQWQVRGTSDGSREGRKCGCLSSQRYLKGGKGSSLRRPVECSVATVVNSWLRH